MIISPYEQKLYPTEPNQLQYSYAIDPETFKYVVLKMCVDSGVDIMFHTYFADAIVEDDTVKGVVVENKSGRQAVLGRVVVDASGDADVAARAGVPYWQTHKDENPRLGDTLMYRVSLDKTRPDKLPAVDFGDTAVLWGPGLPAVDGTDADDLSRAEIEARLQVYEHLETVKGHYPQVSSARVVETPPLLGVRQTRFIEGEYVLNADDVIEGHRFDDVIALCAHPIIHIYGYRRYLEHEGYDIPYRCLVPKKVENLLVAGRCISCTQEAYESFRAMVPVMAIGQAAGVAAGICSRRGILPRSVDVKNVQAVLKEQGAQLELASGLVE